MTTKTRNLMLCAFVTFNALPTVANAGIAKFSRVSDTILVPGHISVANTLTLEAFVKFDTSQPAWSGDIFHEQYFGACDTALEAGENWLYGGAYPDDGGISVTAPGVMVDKWHHVAFVRDQGDARLYLDGTLVGSKSGLTGSIGSSSSSWMSVGSFQYTFYGVEGWHRSFLGSLDWLRVSSNVRYTGSNFAVPSEPSNDDHTLLLYNFNDAPGSSVVNDLSANHWDGQLGIGYFGAYATPTSPTLTTEQIHILAQPLSQVGYWGKSVTFSITASGGNPPYTYQWLKDDIEIDGATGSQLELTNLQAENAGSYTAAVKDADNTSLISQAANLTVNPAGVSVEMHAAVKIDGVVGQIYGIQATTELTNSNSWAGVANVQLAQPTQIWYDPNSTTEQPRRFYRVVAGPISIP